MTRPYMTRSVDQLEQLLEVASDDPAVLRLLAEELTFRKTARAKELQSEVLRLMADVEALSRSPRGLGERPADAPPNVPPVPEHAEAPSLSAAPIGDSVEQDFPDRPVDVLEAWSALEVLSPYLYRRPVDLANGNSSNLVTIAHGRLPWDAGSAKAKPNFRVYFHVVIGTIAAKHAMDALVARFNDTRIEWPRVEGDIVLASVLVDKDGLLAGDTPVSLSAFGWGLPVALRGSLKDLAAWTDEETRVVMALKRQLIPEGQDEQSTPVTWERLQQAFAWLVSALGLPSEHAEGPRFAVAVYMPFRSRIVPDGLLLNSFFLRDLAKARALAVGRKLPGALALFLGERSPETRRDVLHDVAALEASLAPRGVPLGRWPTSSGHAPALLQQSAVNLAASMHGRSGMLGVNGPPGTGKSTLLRDVVADLMTRRAQAMCAFADPARAFKVGWSRRARGETIEIHALDASLRGFEMVVASSNNKAVENVSAELPALGALPAASTLRYFAPLAQDLLERDAWGLVAAVLGNATNRARFRKGFWADSPRSFKRYLEHVSGIASSSRQEGDLASLCDGPANLQEAQERWKTARARFNAVSRQVADRLAQLEQLRQALQVLPDLRAEEALAEEVHEDALVARKQAESVLQAHVQASRDAAAVLQSAAVALAAHDHRKPRWYALKRVLGSASAKAWESDRTPLAKAQVDSQYSNDEAEGAQAHADRLAREARRDVRSATEDLERARSARKAQEQHCRTIQVGAGALILDEAFQAQTHGEKQLAVAWLDRDVQQLRMQVFESAVAVHQAFIDSAARPLLHNLNALVGGNFHLPPDRKEVLGDVWASLFLVIPVVSTAFASVERMLGQVPPDTLGWLLVDEAGQASPQSAVGAIMRCRRAVVVGDPQQVEPVVTLPDTLTAAVLREFGVDPDRFSAPSASVQTLADDASEHAATFATATGSRTVGSPLLVHRRCASPMFDISNAIAYSGLMVQAKRPAPSAIRDVLGPSHWIDVRGQGRDKYSTEEGEQVMALLRRLRDAGAPPDLYIVTPFVAVQDGLRKLVVRSGILTGWVADSSAWTWERIGTVHTVQGREAEAVIVVLGAPEPGQHGARLWAGMRANLLNVAVTRAKEALYVIGNRQLWAGAGHFSTLDRLLP
jgi:hypothetical protein